MLISKPALGVLAFIATLCIFIPAFYVIIKSIVATIKAKEWLSAAINVVIFGVGVYFFVEIMGGFFPIDKWLDGTTPLGENSEFIASMSNQPALRACCGIGGVIVLLGVILYGIFGGYRMVSKMFKEKQTAKGVIYSVFFVAAMICLAEIASWFFPMSKWF